MSEHLSKTTTDHEEIKKWAEACGASRSCVKKTGSKGDVGLLRLDFPGYSGADSLEHIEWDEFFEKFDEVILALVYQEKNRRGRRSNFHKLVSRDSADHKGSAHKTAPAKKTTAKTSQSRPPAPRPANYRAASRRDRSPGSLLDPLRVQP